jgi:hypothetical protein
VSVAIYWHSAIGARRATGANKALSVFAKFDCLRRRDAHTHTAGVEIGCIIWCHFFKLQNKLVLATVVGQTHTA